MFTVSSYYLLHVHVNLPRSDPGRREKISIYFYFHTCFGTSKGFMNALKALIKPFEHHTEVKTKFKLIFILTELSEMHGAGSVMY